MADAWSTVVIHDPLVTDYDRSRMFAFEQWEDGKCPRCGTYDSLVPASKERGKVVDRDVIWREYDGQRYAVRSFRCLACGAVESVSRDFHDAHRNEKPVKGKAASSDGRIFIARPLTDEED